MKKHSVSDAARTASLTDLRRWPGDGFFGKIPKSESRPRWKNPDLGAGSAGWRLRCRAGSPKLSGSDAGQVARVRRNFRQWSTGQLEKFFEVVGLDDNLEFFFCWEESRPWRGLGSDAGQARPGFYAGQECGALGVGRARTHWANPYWASHQTRLGRAIKRGWGEPSNEVGRARTHWASPYSLGEPVLIGRASWASQFLQWPQWPTPAWRSYGARSAPGARSALCLLGTFS